MPRDIDPGTLKTGSGKASPSESDLHLGGSGMSGAGPNIGEVGGGGGIPDVGAGGSKALDTHIYDPVGAHSASAISVDEFPDLLGTRNVEQSLDALMSGLQNQPSKLGGFSLKEFPALMIPTWGKLSLMDANLAAQQDVTLQPSQEVNLSNYIYPYYFTAASMGRDYFEVMDYGNNASSSDFRGSDPGVIYNGGDIWNVNAVVGGGTGVARAGAFTDSSDVVRTSCIVPLDTGALHVQSCVSGAIFPSDKGVLALIHWPHDGDTAAFLAEDLLDRCYAALLLGQGIRGGDCIHFDDSAGAPVMCDGESGGIFEAGTDETGSYDPFQYPGRASGQYNLEEVCTGISSIDSNPLPAPWDDWDGDGVQGAKRYADSEIPGPGQVRLGTDPDAGMPNVSPYGIPILGATTEAYSGGSYISVDGHNAIGNSFVVGTNFFSYRLPFMASFEGELGMSNTPKGIDYLTTKETARYFTPEPSFSTDASLIVHEVSPGVYKLFRGGAYGFSFSGEVETSSYDLLMGLVSSKISNGWLWQLGRYRHSFYIPDSTTIGPKGTVWLLHFKTEQNFESFVRDGVMPWDATDGYELYGAYPATSAMENYGNVVNQDTSMAAPPRGEAPDYGYGSPSYFTNRSSIYVGERAEHDNVTLSTNTWQYKIAALDNLMFVSGVQYFTPLQATTGAPDFTIDGLLAVVPSTSDPWDQGYRTDDNPLTGNPGAAPAVISSPDPAFVYMGQFSYDTDTGDPDGTPTFTTPAGFTHPLGERRQRIEFPYEFAGTHGGNPFSEMNGPTGTDDLFVNLAGEITLLGDGQNPAFTQDAAPRFFVRRPLTHDQWEFAVQPEFKTPDGAGEELVEVNGDTILFHSTNFAIAGSQGIFGNYKPVGAVPTPCYSWLVSAEKDVEERFLDEVYRYENLWNAQTTVIENYLKGPGMQGYSAGPLAVPVQAGTTMVAPWNSCSFVQADIHFASLNSSLELQVAGLPGRNPPLSDWVYVPFPSAGIVQYPVTDYSAGYEPSIATYPIPAQPDYSAVTGDRVYVRAFDVAYSRHTTPEDVVGGNIAYLKIDGVTLEDFAYEAPGPGSSSSRGLAILVKVPGQTTWMDVGRLNGDGPSKQDPAQDGAGCQAAGPHTFNSQDPETGIRYAQVKVDVGPVATLAKGQGEEVPILVKVWMRDPATTPGSYDATYYDFNHEADGTNYGSFTGSTGKAISTGDVRGVCGIKVLTATEATSD